MKSDFMNDLTGGHTASIWVDARDILTLIYRDKSNNIKRKEYKVGEISPSEVAFILDMDMKDGQIWVQKIKAIVHYSPWYDDIWFNGLQDFRDAACHPYSQQGRNLTKFFKRLTPQIKAALK